MVAVTLPSLLLIDDDPMVRRALVRVLKRKFAVVELDAAEKALDALDAGRTFDAIVCDLNLAGMSGRSFLAALLAMRDPHAGRTLILSGMSRAALGDPFLDELGPRFLEKPASAAQIEAAIGDILRQRARAA